MYVLKESGEMYQCQGWVEILVPIPCAVKIGVQVDKPTREALNQMESWQT